MDRSIIRIISLSQFRMRFKLIHFLLAGFLVGCGTEFKTVPGCVDGSCGTDASSSLGGDNSEGGNNLPGTPGGSSGGPGAGSDPGGGPGGSAPAPVNACATTPESFIPDWVLNYIPEKEFYISPTGNDSNAGTSPQAPLKSVAAAVAKAGPGVRLNFMTGTWNCVGLSFNNIKGGTARPLSIRSVDGLRKAKFNCAGSGDMGFISTQGLIIDGVEVSHSGGHGIYIRGATKTDQANNAVVMNSYIHHTGYACLKSNWSDYISVINSECAYANPGRLMFEFVASGHVALAGIDAHHGGAFNEVKGGIDSAILFGNYIHDNNTGISIYVGGPGTGYQFLVDPSVTYEAKNVKVWNNVMINSGTTAFRFDGCQDCIVANNTYSVNNSTSAMRILRNEIIGGPSGNIYTPNKNLKIYNNIFSTQGNFVWMIPGQQSETVGLEMSHNVFYWGGGGAYPGTDIEYKNLPNSFYQIVPGFVNPLTNVALQPSSPIIGKGKVLDFINGNYNGDCWNGAPNIGAL